LVFLLVSIIIPACFTDETPSVVSKQVTNFEFVTFQNAPLNGLAACTAFHAIFPRDDESDSSEENVLSRDCNRYKTALACYNEIRTQAGTQTADGNPAEQDLSTNDRLQIEQACANAK
jgi:hypothetical protein